MKASPRYGNE